MTPTERIDLLIFNFRERHEFELCEEDIEAIEDLRSECRLAIDGIDDVVEREQVQYDRAEAAEAKLEEARDLIERLRLEGAQARVALQGVQP